MANISSELRWPWVGDVRNDPGYWVSMSPKGYPIPRFFTCRNFIANLWLDPPTPNQMEAFAVCAPRDELGHFSFHVWAPIYDEWQSVCFCDIPGVEPSFSDTQKYENVIMSSFFLGGEAWVNYIRKLWMISPTGIDIEIDFEYAGNPPVPGALYYNMYGRFLPQPSYWVPPTDAYKTPRG